MYLILITRIWLKIYTIYRTQPQGRNNDISTIEIVKKVDFS